MSRYDIAIIGTGPAGLEAALTAKARNKNILLIGSADLSAKVTKAHTIQNYLGLSNVSGREMQEAFLKQIESAGIKITDEQAKNIYAMGDYFVIQTGEIDSMVEAETLILATGLSQTKGLPGEDQFLGKGVSYCATCDAALFRGKKTAVIGYAPREENEADFLSELASEVLYFPQYAGEVRTAPTVKVIREKPVGILGDLSARTLETDGGEYEVDGIFILRDNIAPDKLVPGLELDAGHVKVTPQMETNIPGCFAAGDITGPPYQYIKAAGQGNVAALAAVNYLAAKRKE
ncbi:MAG: NAD(P)/FAD-dependent oxidoreductase [Thermoguttaceae bacterium]|nr:NAD(P)/FAD-dependent oxidoreductase [Thermoguttaceae bacterium]